nr:polysaccharide biosynthesis tyrosine autokinase [uncultured Blautia sp.]
MEERIDSENVQQIDLISMLKDIGREWITILLLSVAAALFADIWICATYQPEYKTSTTFVVTAKGMNSNIYQNLTSTKDLAQQFTEILGSNVLKKKVAQDIGVNSLDVETSVDLVPETNLITLSVKAKTAAESYRVLRSVMENYNTVSDYAIKNVIIETIQQPSVAMSPSNPLNEKRMVLKVFLIAAGCLIVLVAGISYIRDTIKNPGEVSSKLDTRLLGTIAYEKKSKSLSMNRKKGYLSMLISNPLRSFSYVESSKMAASRVRSYMDKEQAKVLLVTSVMENEGKSTVAANLALSLAQEGNRVMLMDCDFRKPAQFKIFDVRDNEETDLGDVLINHKSADRIIRNWNDSNLYMILNKTSSNSIETLLKSTTLKQIIAFCRERMDYVVVDTSPLALVADTEELAQMTDASVLVVRQDTVLAKDINDAIDILNNTRGKVIGCILNGTASQSTGGNSHYRYGGHYGKRA